MNFEISSAVQITLVDESVRTVLPPAIDRSFKTKTVIIIRTPDFKEDALALLQAYSKFNIKGVIENLSSSLNFSQVEVELKQIIDDYKYLSPVVNVSNGSKLHSIALFKVAHEAKLPVFVVNANDTVSWISQEIVPITEIEDRINIPSFLEASGFNYLKDVVPTENKQLRELLEWLVSNINVFQKAISQLNYFAYTAREHGVSKPIKGEFSQLQKLLERFSSLNLAQLINNRIHFSNEEVRFFSNGGWLEEFIYHQIAEISRSTPSLQDYRSSVFLSSKVHDVRNEIDNVALFNNQLFLIECKTKKFTDRGHPEGGAMDAIYKMDTLMSELGGPIAKGMIVSVYPFSKAERKRAKQYDIELVSFEEIKSINSRLKNWFGI